MEFKYKSKYIRQKLFMSQEDFAKALGVSFPIVNRWESGRTSPNYKAQKAIHEICVKNGIKLDD